MKLFKFQTDAAIQIRKRYLDYAKSPNRIGGIEQPFVQLLNSITGSGKTPMLAYAMSEIRQHSKQAPLVLWISKGKVVVDQTTANFLEGGKYRDNVKEFAVRRLSDVSVREIIDEGGPLIVTSTVAAFNREDKEGLNVHRIQQDKGNMSIWDAISRRAQKSPLFIVYDEGHNSTDKQLDMLLDLNPKGVILSSATMDLTPKLSKIISNQNYTDDLSKMKNNLDPVVTWVDTKQAVDMELVKSSIHIGGRSNLDEYIIQEMHKQYQVLSKKADALGISPKCIYISNTNINARLGHPDDEEMPFHQRQARPIVIWRFLVEKCKVNPKEIAVYCDLQGRKDTFPKDFCLFRGGENDYAKLIDGDFKHIIFNLSLQEGWDDPECYFAYIDKDMGSRVQITQVIGRVLRQPKAKYQKDESLNTAHFFIRFQNKEEFRKVLEQVRLEMEGRTPGIKVTGTFNGQGSFAPLSPKKVLAVPKAAIDRVDASNKMSEELKRFFDYSGSDDAKATGQGADVSLDTASGRYLNGMDANSRLVWDAKGPGQPIQIGRYIQKRLMEINPGASEAVLVDPQKYPKLAAKVDLGSVACIKADELAQKLSNLYEESVSIVIDRYSEYKIGEYQPHKNIEHFSNALHAGYDGLNGDELACAQAIDKTRLPWVRNYPPNGYFLPLPLAGSARRFFPDFCVFDKKMIWLIEPKGAHLLKESIRNKMLFIDRQQGAPEIKVVLISKGQYDNTGKQLSANGVTVFRKRSGNSQAEHFSDYEACVFGVLGVGKQKRGG